MPLQDTTVFPVTGTLFTDRAKNQVVVRPKYIACSMLTPDNKIVRLAAIVAPNGDGQEFYDALAKCDPGQSVTFQVRYEEQLYKGQITKRWIITTPEYEAKRANQRASEAAALAAEAAAHIENEPDAELTGTLPTPAESTLPPSARRAMKQELTQSTK